MDRRFLTVLVVSLLFAGVASGIFYQMSSRMSARPREQKKVDLAGIVVAAAPLAVGVQIKPGDVKIAKIPREQAPGGSFERIEEVVGRPVISNILLDEPVVAGRLAERGSGFGLAPVIPPGMRAVAVKVNEVVGVAGFVVPGMRVDILVTVKPPGDAVARTSTILQNIVVVSAGQQIQPDASGRAVNVPVVTLLVTLEQAETLTLAGNEGRIQLVLRNATDQAVGRTSGRRLTELYGREQPAARPKLAPVSTPIPAPAPPPPAPPDEVVVYRGVQRTVQVLGANGSK